jgi:hypothetical protein
MKLKHTIPVSVCVLLFLNGLVYTQDKKPESQRWNNMSTVVYATGEYISLPQKILPVDRPNVPHIIITPYEALTVYPNIQVLPSTTTTQTEVPLVCSRVNPNFMFGSSNAVSGTINSGSYITTNGGLNWFGSNIINNGNPNNQRGDPGPTIDKNQRVIFTHISSAINFGSVTGTAAEYSTDFGQTFSTSFQVHTSGYDDKNLAGTDDNPASPFYGNSYMAFCNYVAGTTFVARTTNGGVSWDPAVSWAPPGGLIAQGHDVDCTPNGTVIVAYTLHASLSESNVGIGRSTDGGVTYSVTAPAYTVSGTRSNSFNGWGVRTNGFPRISIDKSGGARNGWIYIVTDEINLAPAGSDADVILHRSTDGGLTWSAGIRVNQDPLNNGKVQFFPCVNVDAAGGVNVAYYDNRNFPSVGDSCSVFISRSLDGGTTWTDFEVADHHFKPKSCTGLGGYMGDYIGVTSGNGKVWAFWMDDKAGSPGFFNAWAGYITTSTSTNHDIACGPFLSLPATFVINNPYPIKTKVTNVGSSNETGIPVKFFINGTLINTTNINLNTGQSDSVSNNWTPAVAGAYTLTYCSALPTDTNRTNDTVKVTVNVFTSLPALCEGFNSTTFPPTNWTRTGTGSNYWSRATVSGFGNGQGSAMYDNFIAPLGTIGNLITLTFPATSSGDSVHFALAYCRWTSYPTDSLIILTSTNAGTSYTSLVRLGEPQLNTASGSCTHPFTPVAADWGRRSYLLPVGTNKITFQAYSGFGDHLYIDSIGTNPCWNINGISNKNNEVPRTYSLLQNYPNPFNPVTNIKYSLPNSSFVKLVVYDITGREVMTLVNGTKSAGNYSVDFDGNNIASGIYFYKIDASDVSGKATNFTNVKKMVLVK